MRKLWLLISLRAAATSDQTCSAYLGWVSSSGPIACTHSMHSDEKLMKGLWPLVMTYSCCF